MSNDEKCACRQPKPEITVLLKCNAVMDGRSIKPNLASIELDSCVKCNTCGRFIDSKDCAFGPIRDVVHRVCASCVLNDGEIRFDTDRENCKRTPITGGPVYVKATGKYI